MVMVNETVTCPAYTVMRYTSLDHNSTSSELVQEGTINFDLISSKYACALYRFHKKGKYKQTVTNKAYHHK